MYTETQKEAVLNDVHSGTPITEAAKKHGISANTIGKWKKDSKRKLRASTPKATTRVLSDAAVISLRDENTRLKCALADLYLRKLN